MNSGIVTIKLDMSKIEHREEFEHIRKASNYASALGDIGNYVFRPARKHGYSDPDIHFLITAIDEKMGQDNEGATELVSLLEQKFYSILNEHNANPDEE